MKSKREAILDRIRRMEGEIAKGREYLETGAHAYWIGFRPAFVPKMKDGRPSPPHRDWVRNVFIPARERAIRKSESILESMSTAHRARG